MLVLFKILRFVNTYSKFKIKFGVLQLSRIFLNFDLLELYLTVNIRPIHITPKTFTFYRIEDMDMTTPL